MYARCTLGAQPSSGEVRVDLRARFVAPLTELRARSQRLVQLNLELLAGELREKGAQYGLALGLFVGAAVLALFALGFALATVTVALDLLVPLWTALLIVTIALLLLVALLALVGRNRILRAGSPLPEKALAEAQATVEAVRAQASRVVASVAQPTRGEGATSRPAGQAAPFVPHWQARPTRDSLRSGAPVVVATPKRPVSGERSAGES